MTQPQIPPEVMYGSFRPKGYYTQFKQWPISPMSSNQYWSPDQIVRFLITIKSGVMDPYRSHIQMVVKTNIQTNPVGGLQVDSSAQNFISQTVISSNNIQIQRMTEYDTLATYLTDIGFSQYVCESRQVQGLGYSNLPSHSPYSTTTVSQGQSFYSFGEKNSTIVQNISSGLVMPSKAPFWTGKSNTMSTQQPISYTMSSMQVGGYSPSVTSLSNVLWQNPGQFNMQWQINANGRFGNVRAEYMSLINEPNYPDSTSSFLLTSPTVQNQTYQFNQMTQNSSNSGFNPKNPYSISFPTSTQVNQVNIQSGQVMSAYQIPTSCNLFGFQKPISGQFARGTKQSFISATVPQCQMQNGQILPTKIPISTQLFRIPLLSTVCGILIPSDQFLLIPVQSLYNLLLQVTLSKFAMFTTGYCDVHQFDMRGMSFMQPRTWTISQMWWNLHLYTFSDDIVNRQIQASLVKGIPISSTSYTLASQYQLPSGQVVRNSWPVGTQSESLCQVIVLFLSNQYQSKTFCRKQFRLSNNITSMQIKFNTQFFPSQPLTGNAGNPQTIDTTGDNWDFYQQILLSSNYLFNTNMPLPKINMKNFAINGRCYNTNNTRTFWDPTMANNWQYQFTNTSVNADTALGMASFHQNRYVGKAAFVYTWQPYGHSKQYMTGINAQGVQNFSIIFNTTNVNPFPSDQTMLIFTRQNVIVLYGIDGVKVIGK